MMGGINIEATVRLAQSMTIPVIASGGVHNIKDVEALCAVQDEGIEAVICGRSIYEGTLDLQSAQLRADELSGDGSARTASGILDQEQS
jgi:phosphoribosylformimino-5-aminoimidazole carboxamide ribotide isomerase